MKRDGTFNVPKTAVIRPVESIDIRQTGKKRANVFARCVSR